MPFWIFAALLTLLACLVLLVPLAHKRSVAETGSDLAVYEDQFVELDRDVERGAINAAEAAEARAEIGRRILKAAGKDKDADKDNAPDRTGSSRAGRIVATLAVLAVPLASWGIYTAIGSPHLPAQPLAARLAGNPAENTIQELVARAERHLADNPEDGRGWEVVAPIYQRLGKYGEAATAWSHAIRLLGPNAAREVAYGEAIASSANGMITEQARAAFERALVLEPENFKARFALAAALAQENRQDEAATALRAMLPDLPAGSPWQETVANAIADLEGGTRTEANGGQAEIGNAGAGGLVLDQDQAEMIDGMVASLDSRLREQPDDPAGWQQLVRSYVVLGKLDAAADALARGVDALDDKAAAELLQFAASLGVAVKE